MKVPRLFKRKKEGLTDYRKRYSLVKSGTTRLVIRPSNKGITAQLVDYGASGDRIISTVTNKSLSKFGVELSGNSTPVSYLVGYAAGLKARKNKIEEAILDTGRYSLIPGGRISATLRGFVDAGVEIPHDPSVFPDDSRISGEHLKNKDAFTGNLDKFKSKLEESI